MKLKIPVETTEVFLPSTGLNYRMTTKHVYAYSDVVTVRCGSTMVTGIGHFYRCSVTGELRQYGFDSQRTN